MGNDGKHSSTKITLLVSHAKQLSCSSLELRTELVLMGFVVDMLLHVGCIACCKSAAAKPAGWSAGWSATLCRICAEGRGYQVERSCPSTYLEYRRVIVWDPAAFLGWMFLQGAVQKFCWLLCCWRRNWLKFLSFGAGAHPQINDPDGAVVGRCHPLSPSGRWLTSARLCVGMMHARTPDGVIWQPHERFWGLWA